MNTQEKIESLITTITAISPYSDTTRPAFRQSVKCSNGQDIERISIHSDSTTVGCLRDFLASDVFSPEDYIYIEPDHEYESVEISAYKYAPYTDAHYIAHLENILRGFRSYQVVNLPSGDTIHLTKEDLDYLTRIARMTV